MLSVYDVNLSSSDVRRSLFFIRQNVFSNNPLLIWKLWFVNIGNLLDGSRLNLTDYWINNIIKPDNEYILPEQPFYWLGWSTYQQSGRAANTRYPPGIHHRLRAINLNHRPLFSYQGGPLHGSTPYSAIMWLETGGRVLTQAPRSQEHHIDLFVPSAGNDTNFKPTPCVNNYFETMSLVSLFWMFRKRLYKNVVVFHRRVSYIITDE